MADLSDFVSQITGSEVKRVEENLGEGFYRLNIDEAERRQAAHDIQCIENAIVELLRNSFDAGASRIFVATSKTDNIRTLTILDNGSGVPKHMQKTIFDARVTSKLDTVHMDRWGVHGRGMALYSISENVEEAAVVASEKGLGTSIKIVTDSDKLNERKDQSTWPLISKDEEGTRTLGAGPHNIIRTCAEFAMEEEGKCDVYLGSPAEIISTVRGRLSREINMADLLFTDDIETLPVLYRLLVPGEAAELASVAESLGLSISERTAHRILNNKITVLRSVSQRLSHSANDLQAEVDISKDARGLKLSSDDIEEFSLTMESAFKDLSDKYYLLLSSEPKVRVSHNKISVTFNFEKDE